MYHLTGPSVLYQFYICNSLMDDLSYDLLQFFSVYLIPWHSNLQFFIFSHPQQKLYSAMLGESEDIKSKGTILLTLLQGAVAAKWLVPVVMVMPKIR